MWGPRSPTRAELNAWLADRCVAHARETAHPEQKQESIFAVFEAEQPSLIGYRGRFDGFHEVEAVVAKSSLVRFDHNRYSVAAKAARRAVQLRAYRALPDPSERCQQS